MRAAPTPALHTIRHPIRHLRRTPPVALHAAARDHHHLRSPAMEGQKQELKRLAVFCGSNSGANPAYAAAARALGQEMARQGAPPAA